MGKLKLFVWQDVLTDWTSGIMFALAHDAEEARNVILTKYPDSVSVSNDLSIEPEIYASPVGFAVRGGG